MAIAQRVSILSRAEANPFDRNELADRCPAIVFSRSIDDGWPIRCTSGCCAAITGFDADSLSNDAKYASLIHPDDAAGITAAVRDAAGEKAAYSVEYRIRTKGGVEKWVCEKGFVVLDDSGELEGFNGFISDITEFKAREEALAMKLRQYEGLSHSAPPAPGADGQNLLRILVDNLQECVFVKDTTGRYTLSNAAHVRAVGLKSSSEVEGKTTFDLLPKEVAERITTEDRHVLTTGEPILNKEELRSGPDQKQIWLNVTKIPLRGPDGAITGLLCICRDISEHKNLEEEIRQSQKMEAIGRLAGGVAHDFNNILTSVIGFSELLLTNDRLDAQAHKDVEEIFSAATRASALTQQLLTFGREQAPQPAMVNLNDALVRLEPLLHQVTGDNISLVMRPGSDLGHVFIDPGQIEQVLTSIVGNARDAMPQGGSITLATGNINLDKAEAEKRSGLVPGPYVWMSITDNGPGIPEEMRKKIFLPAFNTAALGKATGPGLAASYGIIRKNRGHIDLQSVIGEGTTITVLLPARQKEALLRDDEHDQAPPPVGTETILLVEDDPSVRKLSASLLRKLGYTVLEADGGAKAMNVIRECDMQKIDLLLTDVVMPQIGGKRLADNLEVLSPGTRVLFTSGYNEEEIRMQGISAREISFLPKPFSPVLLAKKIREVLDR